MLCTHIRTSGGGRLAVDSTTSLLIPASFLEKQNINLQHVTRRPILMQSTGAAAANIRIVIATVVTET
jgi:hypothetical protein